jgi:hypothetical protein
MIEKKQIVLPLKSNEKCRIPPNWINKKLFRSKTMKGERWRLKTAKESFKRLFIKSASRWRRRKCSRSQKTTLDMLS